MQDLGDVPSTSRSTPQQHFTMFEVQGHSLLTGSVLAVIVLLAVKVVLTLHRTSTLRKIMPPGPPGLPLLGNLFELPKSGQHEYVYKLKYRWGGMYSLNLAGQPMIVVNSVKIARELLERASLSDRPHSIMTNDLLCDGHFVAFTPYGALWRKLRRAAHAGFNQRASQEYQPIQEREASVLVKNIIRSPERWMDHIRRSAASNVLSVVYGWQPLDSSSDPVVARINEFMHRVLTASVPGAFLVEIFPAMLHIPARFAKWKRWALEWHEKDTKLFTEFLDGARKKAEAGEADATFAATLLQSEKKQDLNTKEAAWLAGSMFGAGSDTTAASVEVALLAMSLHPEAMHRAQAEIDKIVGRHRMPTFADQVNLPYVTAVVKEVLRWRTVSALLLRRALEDDWYGQYFIPKGTLMFFNAWGLNRDEEFYPEPEKFRPERFLDADGQLAEPLEGTHEQGHLAFGSGRRMCVGMHVANQALFIDMASMLWAFDVEPADMGDSSMMASREDDTDDGLLVRPSPFKVSIKPRTPDVELVLGQITAGTAHP